MVCGWNFYITIFWHWTGTRRQSQATCIQELMYKRMCCLSRYLGLFTQEVDAALAYDRESVKRKGLKATTNFGICRYLDLLSELLTISKASALILSLELCHCGLALWRWDHLQALKRLSLLVSWVVDHKYMLWNRLWYCSVHYKHALELIFRELHCDNLSSSLEMKNLRVLIWLQHQMLIRQ